jgi:hypothetical protein
MPVRAGTLARGKAAVRPVMLVAPARILARATAVVPQAPNMIVQARTTARARVDVVQAITDVPAKILVKEKAVVVYQSRKVISVNG